MDTLPLPVCSELVVEFIEDEESGTEETVLSIIETYLLTLIDSLEGDEDDL